MGTDNWFQNTQWSSETAGKFEAKLSRARRKPQYLRIQASCLARSAPDVALGLLDRYFDLDDDFDHAQAHCDRAAAYLSLGRIDDAVRSYENALRREAEFPSSRTQACLELPFLIATTPLDDRFEQALAVLNDPSHSLLFRMFPVDVFRWNTCHALISSVHGCEAESSTYAAAALEAASQSESGFRYHESLGLVGDQYPELIRRLGVLAHAT